MKKILWTIIVLMCTIIIFLMLYTFGMFNYGSIIDNAQFTFHAQKRKHTVNTDNAWNIGVIGTYDDGSFISGIAPGIGKAAHIINLAGGILGKHVSTIIATTPPESYDVNLAAQHLCETTDIAFFLGPMRTSYVESVRAITQYHALPGLTPFALILPETGKLEPNLFASLYPYELLIAPLVEALKEQGYRRLLFITTAPKSFGGVFAMKLGDTLREEAFFQDIYRMNFTSPATHAEFMGPLRQIRDNCEFDAIIYTDSPDNLRVLATVLAELQIKVPVFGNDFLDVPGMLHNEGYNFPLRYVTLRGSLLSAAQEAEYTNVFGYKPPFKEQWGILGLYIFREALEKVGTYDPVAIGATIQELAAIHYRNYATRLQAIVIDASQKEERP